MTHSNLDLLKMRRKDGEAHISEAVVLREKFQMQTRINWRYLSKGAPFTPAAKREFLAMRREANKHFRNETVVRYTAY